MGVYKFNMLSKIFLCLLAWVSFSGSVIPPVQGKELARVDDIVIEVSDFEHMISLLPDYYLREKNSNKINKNRLLDKLINETLIAREAKKINIQEREDFKRRLESLTRELLVDVYIKKLMEEKNTEANQRAYREENKEKYSAPEQVRVAVITLQKPEKEAQEIYERVKKGEDFAELARTYSVSASAKNGGDMGFRSKRNLSEDIAEAAFSMKKGEIRGPIKGRGGFHIVKLVDRKDAELIPFESIRTKIYSDYGIKLRDDEIARLRKAAEIHVEEDVLKAVEVRR